VPHPPGYPTYVMLGQMIARIPGGDVAQRFNLFSALGMALAAGFTSLSLLRLITPARPRCTREGVTIVASLFFVTAPMVWGQATIAEVHALNACCVALIVYLIAPIAFRGDDVSLRRLTLAAWLWGLAFGNSLTVAALAPLMIAAGWRSGQTNNSPDKPLAPIMAFLVGLSIYALIPLRAAQQPSINWGDATSLDRFIALVTAEMYRGYALSTLPADLFTRLIGFAQLIVAQYGWPGMILGAIGVYYALVSPNQNWRWLVAALALYLFFALTYSAADSALYLIPVWMFGAWAIARGLLAMTHDAANSTAHVSVILLLVVLLGPAFTVITNFSAMNLRDEHTATEFASEVVVAAPRGAIIITENDGHTFALWYHRHVAGQRPDLAIVDRRLAGYPWYDAMLRAQGSAPLLPEDDPPETWVDRVAELNPDRALCVVDRASQMSCQAQ
jgi:hypothetical protein